MFNKFKTIILLAVFGIYLPTSLFSAKANDFNLNPKTYLGVGGGFTDHETGISGTTGTAELDEEDTGFKVYAGVKLNNYLGFEAFYADLGESSLSGNNGDTFISEGEAFQFTETAELKLDAESYGLGTVVSLPIGNEFYPFVKLGMHQWEVEVTATSSAGNVSLEEDGTDVFYGIGFEWKLAENFGLRAEYERFDSDGDDLDFMSAGLNIFF